MESMTTSWREQLLREAAEELRLGSEEDSWGTIRKLARLLLSLESNDSLSELLCAEDEALLSRMLSRYALSTEAAAALASAGYPNKNTRTAALELIGLIRERPALDAWNVFY
jgi:hypothetical protein